MEVGSDIYPTCLDLAGEPGQWLHGIPAYLSGVKAAVYRKLYSMGDTEP